MNAYGAYYAALVEEAGWIIESRLEDGALLSANLITAAWTEVGKPSPASFTSPPEAVNRGQASEGEAVPKETASEEQKAGYVASRLSKTYHLVTCHHAKRIKESNRIYFDSRRGGGGKWQETMPQLPCPQG